MHRSGDNSKDFYQPAVVEISAQHGGSFSGTISATNPRSGNVGTATIDGVVSGTGAINGQFTGPTDSGTFSGTLTGDTLTALNVTFSGEYQSGSNSCQTTGAFLVIRSWPSQ
jgi:hypothetical protein